MICRKFVITEKSSFRKIANLGIIQDSQRTGFLLKDDKIQKHKMDQFLIMLDNKFCGIIFEIRYWMETGFL